METKSVWRLSSTELHTLLQLTCDSERQQTALRGEVMSENIDAINTAVASSVGWVCSRKQEVSRVTDSWLGVVVCCAGGGEAELEEASWVLRLDGAADGEAGAPVHLKHLLLGLGDPVPGRRHRDDWLNQQVCKHREMIGWISILWGFEAISNYLGRSETVTWHASKRMTDWCLKNTCSDGERKQHLGEGRTSISPLELTI